MYSIYDVDGEKGELGSAATITIIYDVAKKLELENLKDFLDKGYSINVDGVLSDLNDIEFTEITEIEDVMFDFINYVKMSKCIIVTVKQDILDAIILYDNVFFSHSYTSCV